MWEPQMIWHDGAFDSKWICVTMIVDCSWAMIEDEGIEKDGGGGGSGSGSVGDKVSDVFRALRLKSTSENVGL
ncbi:conserved hypothetical protein [Ricinus communis]|uniref:Uncharacterized protein n=1 Tax=Ricinus communis TaxID=3988 RepID=B9R6T6_RICCO|nr:conserved hypothetical protein [Ricinus communis]